MKFWDGFTIVFLVVICIAWITGIAMDSYVWPDISAYYSEQDNTITIKTKRIDAERIGESRIIIITDESTPITYEVSK